jgi:hypothetical protein
MHDQQFQSSERLYKCLESVLYEQNFPFISSYKSQPAVLMQPGSIYSVGPEGQSIDNNIIFLGFDGQPINCDPFNSMSLSPPVPEIGNLKLKFCLIFYLIQALS